MVDSFLHGIEVVEASDGVRSIEVVRTSVIGLIGTAEDADEDVFPLNTPVLIVGNRTEAAKLGATGTLPSAIDSIFDQTGAVVVVIRVAEGEDDEETQDNIIGGVNSTTGNYEGVQAFLGAKSVTGQQPRILIAPEFTHQKTGDTSNPVVAELIGIAERLKAIIVADATNTTDAAAIAYADDWGSSRVFVVDPFVIDRIVAGSPVYKPSSACVAGLIAKIDNTEGFWVSPSNHTINGIIGTKRPIDLVLDDPNCRANLLNEASVATVVREKGYRLWGNLTCSSDPKWQFLCVRRTADILNDSILAAHLWAVDRPITKNYVDEVTEGINSFLSSLKARGAIWGGRCYPNNELNTPENIAAGKIYFDFDFTPVYPAQHITFTSHLVNDYLTEIVSGQ